MGNSGSLRLTLELDLAPSGIRGSLTDGRGEGRPFDGWLQLASTLEVALAEARDRPGDPVHKGPQ